MEESPFLCGPSLYDFAVASFPGLPHFYLLFAFTIIHGNGRPAKNGDNVPKELLPVLLLCIVWGKEWF